MTGGMRAHLRALVAEGLGTALLVATVVGSGIMADRLTEDVALTLMANAVATGAALLVLITVLAPVSGAHFNPVVTLVMALRGNILPAMATGYAVAQGVGGIAGVMLAHAMFDLPIVQVSETMRSGWAQGLSEAVASFGLVLVILGVMRVPGANGGANVGAMVAGYITAAYWFTASTSFANPAVTLARALTDTFAGIRPADVPEFVLAQILGALLALALGGWLFKPAA